MSADPIQTLAAAKIAAAPALAAFGAAIIYDIHADEDAYWSAVTERISSAGVCIDIGPVIAPSQVDTIGGVMSPLLGVFSVFAAEKIGGTHSPAGPALWRAVVAAMCRNQLDAGFTCAGYEAGVHQRGFIIHELTFTHPIFVT